ncbi:MAG: hydantoinase B/oxoprolinase family protein [Betaproteobacteria bacterium]|nr:hydantoinase B/oxoprolinase family protein [Betaproteobacteria bacterium]
MNDSPRWQFWIDRGGTFTDVVARRPDGGLATMKLLSENPERYEDAALEAIRTFLDVAPGAPIPVERIESVKMGTTVATNALLERKGERVLLVVNRGLADLPRIAYQNRPRIFDRHIRLPALLHAGVLEVTARSDAQGCEIAPLDEPVVEAGLRHAFDQGYRALAVVLMHAWRSPDHERRIGDIARRVGFTQVSLSHAVSPLIKIVSRGDTTVVDAYLTPVLRRYVDRVAQALPGTRLLFMQSHGGLTDAHRFQGKDAILSGPAGGIVGMVKTGVAAGCERLIGFDMGGTSTDVSHYAGAYEREFDTLVAGVRLRAPMMSIHTIAAGGGSILAFDGQRFRVGPESAGANPGPACYRRGGPLTVTDANVMLGRIQPAHFPAVFGPQGNLPLDDGVVRAKFAAMAGEVEAATGTATTAEAVAEGFIRIAVANMANAIKFISVQRGHDVTGYALQCFGGAGGQHACQVADELGMTRVLIHPLAGVLSAYGMGLADQRALRERSLQTPLDAGALPAVRSALEALAAEARAELVEQGCDERVLAVEWRVLLKYEGTDTAIAVPLGEIGPMRAAFESAYRQRFSFLMAEKPLVVEAVAVEAVAASGAAAFAAPASATTPEKPPGAAARVRVIAQGEAQECPVLARESIAAGDRVAGPALIIDANATTVIEPGWQAQALAQGELLLTRVAERSGGKAIGTEADPVMLEVFNNLFMSIAEQMGVALANTATSVNIKERLDFSCALFDADANLIANAPHMPVHLGSMGESVRTIALKNAGRMEPGDVYMLNDPYNGGTHLPDVTVVTPVFGATGGIEFFVASRGHHADIGGMSPGSMPPFSRTLEDEGVLIDNFKLIARGHFREAELRALLGAAKHPARNPDQNIADLRAQVAANEKGVAELARMVREFGLDVVHAYMRHVQDNAEEMVRRVIDRLQDGEFAYEMDNAAVIRVAVRVNRGARSAVIDFAGTSAELTSNFNAPRAVVHAAVLYVFRMMVDSDIPLNAGCMKPLTLLIPDGSMLSPRAPAATVAGNVETSQCITDALIGAMGVMAASSGTMNNVTFGNDRYQYYETVSGGSGAGPGFHGCDAVQVHMTNSRLTDPEVLELRYPVRLEEHAIRKGSGGAGQWRGGEGAVRRIRFLEAMSAAILAGHRRIPNFGMAGGAAGATGRTWIERADGSRTELGYSDETAVHAGDVFVLETPGGGGYGRS